MLREEYAALTRQRIIDGFIALLEEMNDVAVPTSAIAKRAEVSLRTVYRYFPSRDDLLRATGDWLNSEVFGIVSGTNEKELVQGFRTAAEKFDSRPNLARILALTRVGRSMRIRFRNELALRRRKALWRDTPDVPLAARVRAEAVVACLDNVLSWLTLKEEFGMNGKDAGAVISWAIELVLRETRAEAGWHDDTEQP